MVDTIVGDIFFVGKTGSEIKVQGRVFVNRGVAWSVDTTCDHASGGPEMELPEGSQWVQLPHRRFGCPVWERV